MHRPLPLQLGCRVRAPRRRDESLAADERVNREFYVAPVYNRMIAAGREVRIDVAKEVWVLGTPEDLAHFHEHYRGPTP